MGRSAWPGSQVKLFKDALPIEVAQQVVDEADCISQCPNYWSSAVKASMDRPKPYVFPWIQS